MHLQCSHVRTKLHSTAHAVACFQPSLYDFDGTPAVLSKSAALEARVRTSRFTLTDVVYAMALALWTSLYSRQLL